jgi:prepilin-type N-terminal cleavage/methylation domain-containing protein
MVSCRSRRAVTLLELIIVIAIIGLLLSLLLAGVMRVREAALIVQSKNNLRQIALGINHFDASLGHLPVVGDAEQVRIARNGHVAFAPGKEYPPLYLLLLPFLDGQTVVSDNVMKMPPIATLLSPADPSASEALARNAAVSSYAANAQAFVGSPRLAMTFADGTSNTIAFAEHYAFNCNGFFFPYWMSGYGHLQWQGRYIHRPAFADWDDVVPETQGNPPVTKPSSTPKVPVKTFQVAPSMRACSSFIPQTPHTSGMLVAMADGGVRQLAPNISPSLFWSVVTPAGGEILGNDW